MISETVPSEHCDSTCGNKLTAIHVFFMLLLSITCLDMHTRAGIFFFCPVMCPWRELPILPME